MVAMMVEPTDCHSAASTVDVLVAWMVDLMVGSMVGSMAGWLVAQTAGR